MTQLLLAVSGFIVCTSLVFADIQSEGGNCEKCTSYFDEVLEHTLKDKISSLEPYHAKGLGRCKSCTFTGIHDFHRLQDKPVCVTKTANGTITQHISIEFPNITGTCQCSVTKDTDMMMKYFAELIASPVITKCIPIKMMESVQNFMPPEVTTEDVKDLQTCLPSFFEMTKKSKELEELHELTLGANWEHAKFSFDLITKEEDSKAYIENLEIINDNNSLFKHACNGPDYFKEVCRCAIETKYLGYFYFQMFKIVLSCSVEFQGQQDFPSDVLRKMVCAA